MTHTQRFCAYFYPRSPCGERLNTADKEARKRLISIHALLAESDYTMTTTICIAWKFLSTLSLRRATCRPKHSANPKDYFYPRSPCGERPIKGKPASPVVSISIHALLAESDPPRVVREPARTRFLSTLSLRRATPAEHHANSQQEFLSTLSLRRATLYRPPPLTSRAISIHALLAESDLLSCSVKTMSALFLSTLSLRRATGFGFARLVACANFYPRSPCGERRPHCYKQTAYFFYFYPRSPCGERL